MMEGNWSVYGTYEPKDYYHSPTIYILGPSTSGWCSSDFFSLCFPADNKVKFVGPELNDPKLSSDSFEVQKELEVMWRDYQG